MVNCQWAKANWNLRVTNYFMVKETQSGGRNRPIGLN